MKQTSHNFKPNVKKALRDKTLKVALHRTTTLLQSRRRDVIAAYPEYAEARTRAEKIKNHTLDNLEYYLNQFEENAVKSGAKVYWASTPADASQIVVDICKIEKAKTATRVKSMLGEEIGIGEALASAGVERVETDLAEHIIQLANEPPSHIVMPAMHKTHEQVAKLFREKHQDPTMSEEVADLVECQARAAA